MAMRAASRHGGRPRLPEELRREQFCLNLRRPVLQAIRERAAREDRSISSVLDEICERWWQEEETREGAKSRLETLAE